MQITNSVNLLTLWRPLGFGDFQKKKRLNTRGFVQEYSPVQYALQTR